MEGLFANRQGRCRLVLRSLERFDYRVVSCYQLHGVMDERIEQRIKELMYYLKCEVEIYEDLLFGHTYQPSRSEQIRHVLQTLSCTEAVFVARGFL